MVPEPFVEDSEPSVDDWCKVLTSPNMGRVVSTVGVTPSASGVGRGGSAASRAARERDARGIPALDEVHVWEFSLEDPRAVPGLERLLAADELERANRFHFAGDRSRYVAGRGMLRLLLANYTGDQPGRIELSYGPNGKPELAGTELRFNLAHSGAVALYAFSSGADVGIDVELADVDFAGEQIAERFFSPSEVATLRSLPSDEQALAFLRCWTRKEAFIKARGDGLMLPLDAFDVTLDVRHEAALTRTQWSWSEPGQWSLADLSDPQGRFIAAAARRSENFKVIARNTDEVFDNEMVSNQEDR
jgi:4'-phosphopantetheinyl transferase